MIVSNSFERIAEEYISLFNEFYPDKNITDKCYDVTIIRWLIMYFLYQEKKINKNKNVNVLNISIYFNQKSHTTVTKAISKIDLYLEDRRLLESDVNKDYKNKFFLFFYKFQKIFTKNQASLN